MSRALSGKFRMADLEIHRPETSANNGPDLAAPVVSAPNFSAGNEPSYAHTLFFGADGLRPGWGFLFYIVSFLALQQFSVALAWSHDFGDSGLWSMMLEEFGNLVGAVVPAIVLSRVEHRPWGNYGLPPSRAFGKLFWTGILWGFLAISLLMCAIYAGHGFTFGHIVLHGARLVKFAAFWALMFLLVGLFEDFLLRGYAQFTLARGIGFWPAAIVLSCTFGLIHLRNGGEQWPGLLAAASIGFFFCLTLRRTGNLWFAVGFHASWDWGETFFYSVPDSGTVSPGHLLSSSLHGPQWLTGGSVGPEGSVLCFLVIAVAWIIFDRTHRQVASSELARS
jgi:membrane protease YdiL (CAAX protease family)